MHKEKDYDDITFEPTKSAGFLLRRENKIKTIPSSFL